MISRKHRDKIHLILTIFVVLVLIGCAKTQEQKELKTTENNISIRIEGAVYPYKKQDIISAVSGYVKDVYVRNGERVKKGDIIYSLDKRIISLDIINVKSEIRSLEQIRNYVVENSIDGSIPAANIAAMELKKVAYLNSKGYISDFEKDNYIKNYINAMLNSKTTKADNFNKVKNLNQEIVNKKIELKKLEFNLQHADAYAEINGFVANLRLSKRESLGIDKKVCTIVDIDKVIVKAGFATGLLPYLHIGQKVNIAFVTTPPYSTKAVISQINPIVNEVFGTMTVEIIVSNYNYLLQSGTRALINIPLSKNGQKEVKKYFLHNKDDRILEVQSKI